MDIKEISLRKCLEEAACHELPRAFVEDGIGFWIKAIALVRKCNGTYSYCLVSHRGDGMVKYERDFGAVSPIYGLVSIHPYVVLDKNRFMSRGTGRSLLVEIASKLGYSLDMLEKCDEHQIEAYRIEMAIKAQMDADQEFVASGHVEDDGQDEDGIVDVFSDKKSKDTSDGIRNENGTVDEITDVVLPLKKKAGRPKKQK